MDQIPDFTKLGLDEVFEHGAQIGYAAGKGRADQYIIQEEVTLSWDARLEWKLVNMTQATEWEYGFQHGYKLAAEGSELDFNRTDQD